MVQHRRTAKFFKRVLAIALGCLAAGAALGACLPALILFYALVAVTNPGTEFWPALLVLTQFGLAVVGLVGLGLLLAWFSVRVWRSAQ